MPNAFDYTGEFGLPDGNTAAGSTSTASGAPPNAGKSGGGGLLLYKLRIVVPTVGLSCMGAVGTKGRFCVARNCSIASHATKKYDFIPTTKSATDTYAFVEIREDTLVASLCIPEEYLGLGMAAYEAEERTIDDWEATFNSLEANGIPEDTRQATTHAEHLLEISKRLSSTPISLLAPEAKRLRRNEIKNKAEADLAAIDVKDIKLPEEVVLNTGNLEEVLRIIGVHLQRIRETVVENECAVKELDLSAIDLKLAYLKEVIGKKGPDDTTGESILESLRSTTASLDELNESALSSKSKDAVENILTEYGPDLSVLGKKIVLGFKKGIDPLLSWIHKWTSVTTGDLLDRRLHELETKLSTRAVTTGLSSMALGNQADPVNLTTSTLERRMQDMEKQLKALNNRSLNKEVRFKGFVFESEVEVEAWLKIHGSRADVETLFVDPHALFAMALNKVKDAEAGTASVYAAKRSGYNTAAEALMRQTFNFEMPLALDKGRKDSLDAYLLGSMPTWESFSGDSPEDGFCYRAHLALDSKGRTLRNIIERQLDGEGAVLAGKCLDTSEKFCSGLLHWMEGTYRTQLRRRPDCKKDNWLYVSSCVRAMFEHLNKCRDIGRGDDAERSLIVWGNLLGVQAAEEFIPQNFAKHTVVQHVLTTHMTRRAIMREEFEALSAKVVETTKLIGELKKKNGKQVKHE